MLKSTRLALVALAAASLSSAAGAQEPTAFVSPAAPPAAPTAASTLTAPVPVAGPRLDAVRSGAALVPEVSRVAERALPAPMRKAPSQRATTLMIVGGAALLGGAIIGDDAGTIIMLGGLGVGLYGLWLYLQ